MSREKSTRGDESRKEEKQKRGADAPSPGIANTLCRRGCTRRLRWRGWETRSRRMEAEGRERKEGNADFERRKVGWELSTRLLVDRKF
jgi:hypothetical protein